MNKKYLNIAIFTKLSDEHQFKKQFLFVTFMTENRSTLLKILHGRKKSTKVLTPFSVILVPICEEYANGQWPLGNFKKKLKTNEWCN